MNRLRGFSLGLLTLAVATTVEAREFVLDPDSDVIGEVEVITAAYEDTFFGLARRYNVGVDDLRRANPGVDYLVPGEGTEIVIPTRYVLPDAPRRGIVLNIPEYRLYYFPDDGSNRVITHPIGTGREGWTTPYGQTTVVGKQHLPTWTPPQSVREEHAARGDILPPVVRPGPDNPLGEHALYLGFASYLIHGTNKPAGVGMRVSHGCIRMFPEDIEALFGMVEPGTPVTIVNQPYKLGWGEGGLYMEAHPPLVEESEQWTATELTRLYVAATREERRVDVRWSEAEAVMHEGRGIPRFVSVEGTITVAEVLEEPEIIE
ncbi:MAG TPA: L,D-transpeptidase family protein [Gammaproteobacteria bacterium]|nr:L,D-transpeptidase family protein [Gammaproteobacteria bacterium]